MISCSEKVIEIDLSCSYDFWNEWVHYKTHIFPIVNIFFPMCEDFVCFDLLV